MHMWPLWLRPIFSYSAHLRCCIQTLSKSYSITVYDSLKKEFQSKRNIAQRRRLFEKLGHMTVQVFYVLFEALLSTKEWILYVKPLFNNLRRITSQNIICYIVLKNQVVVNLLGIQLSILDIVYLSARSFMLRISISSTSAEEQAWLELEGKKGLTLKNHILSKLE